MPFWLSILLSATLALLAAYLRLVQSSTPMPSLSAIRAANAAYFNSSSSVPVAVFVGGTSGIGEGMVRTFAEHTGGKSSIIIVGRNKEAANRILESLPSPPDSAKDDHTKFAREFVQCDATLMKNVQAAAQDILSRHPKVNYLIMSQGFMTLSGRDETPEGIDKKLAVHYYSRWKFLSDLLPALKTASTEGEKVAVMSILGAGAGGSIIEDDLALEKHYSTTNAALIAPTYNDLMMESFAERAPSLPLIHSRPGAVRTNLMAASNSLALRALSPVLLGLIRPFSVNNLDCGQYMWRAIYETANKPGVWRTGSLGEDLKKTRYFGSEAQRNMVWKHTSETINAALAAK